MARKRRAEETKRCGNLENATETYELNNSHVSNGVSTKHCKEVMPITMNCVRTEKNF